ncbi:fungal-specific transcription factor domain-containing protein [Aspergillus granulosus]|uniref:Fungal-specific transcription factor domain-containing protein n=1 Tax=Aspergillus granulosus TaxID=176169 RepID=A0ABR4GXZ4_9EURO
MPSAPSSSSSSSRGGNRYILPDPTAPVQSKSRNVVKSYRRSRSGCFTCRLRRKKCDEERPTCQSCSKLGLRCDYKTPQWWATTEQRNRQRDRIKDRIRQTKVMEKEGSLREYMERIKSMCKKTPATPAVNSTEMSNPLLTEQPAPTINTEVNPYSDSYVDNYVEPLSTPVSATATTPITPFSFVDFQDPESLWPTMGLTNPYSAPAPTFNQINPVNPVNTINQLKPLQPQMPTPELNGDEWYNPTAMPPATTTALYPSQTKQFLQQPYTTLHSLGLGYSGQAPLSTCLQSMIPINENDRPLLDHFVDHVIPLVFPLSESLQTSPERVRDMLNSVKTNRPYMHSCLSAAANHIKASMGLEDDMDHDIVKHRYEAICQLTKAPNRTNLNQMEVMDATLAMIYFHCSVGTADDYLSDVPWTSHFQKVSNLVKNLNTAPSRFNVSMVAWIDIIGATILGETPQFAHTYRTKHLRGVSSGLRLLMGCDDSIMYLISEIACLESLKIEGKLDEMSLYQHINALAGQLDYTEPLDTTLEAPFTPAGVARPEMLVKIVTTLFRLAARIYLYSLLPTFNPYHPSIMNLITSITDTLQYIPAGAHGYDRALVWPLFIAGAHSVPSSHFRKTMSERVTALGYLGDFGSFGRMYRVLKAIWRVADSAPSSPTSSTPDPQSSLEQTQDTAPPLPHWRDVMKQNRWNYLLM